MIDSNIITKPCRVVDFCDGVLWLRFADGELRVRFWPEPFAVVRVDSRDVWKEADYLGDALLARVGFASNVPAPEGAGIRWLSRMRLPLGGRAAENRQRFFWFDLFTEDRDPIWAADQCLRWAVAQIPAAIRVALPHFDCSRWSLLILTAESREVRGLMQSNPMLLALWLRQVGSEPSDVDAAMRRKMAWPQRKQLGELELIAEPRWVKLLQKVPPTEIRHVYWRMLMPLMAITDVKLIRYLQHRQVVTAYEIFLVGATSVLERMEGIGNGGWGAVASVILGTLRRFPQSSSVHLPARLLATLKRLEQLREMRHEFERDSIWHSVALPFPCPEGWEYLNTRDQVNAEGVAQKNCLQNMRRLFNHSYYFFSVQHPVRVTVSVQEINGKFVVHECRAKCNTEVPPALLQCIRQSLSDALTQPIQLPSLS